MPEEIKRPDENLRMLHQALAADKVYQENIPSDYNEFVRLYSNPENAKNLHAALASDIEYQENIPQDFVEAMTLYGLGKPSAVPPSASGSAMPIVNSPMPTEQPEDIQSTQSSAPQYLSPEELGGVQPMPTEAPAPIPQQQKPAPSSEQLEPYFNDVVRKKAIAEIAKKKFEQSKKESESYKGNVLGAVYNGLVESYTKTVNDAAYFTLAMLSSILPEGIDPETAADPKAKADALGEAMKSMGIKDALDEKMKSASTTKEYTERLKRDGGVITEGVLGLAESTFPMVTPMQSGFFITSFTDAHKDIQQNMPNISPEAQLLYATTQGAIAMALEKVGISNVIKNQSVMRTLTGRTLEALKGAGGKLDGVALNETAEKIVNGFAAEFETGATQYVAEESVKQIADLIEGEKDVFEFEGIKDFVANTIKAGATEGVGGGIVKSLGIAANSLRTPKAKEKAQAAEAEMADMVSDMQNPNVSEEAKEAIKKQVDVKAEEILESYAEEQEKFEGLPEETKAAIEYDQEQIKKLQSIIDDPNVSEASKKTAEELINFYNKGIERMLESAPKPAPTEQPLEAEASTDSGQREQDDIKAKKADIERRRQELEKKYEATKQKHLKELEEAGVDLGKWGIAFNDIIHNIEEENNSNNYSKEVETLAREQYEEWWALNREKQEIESDANKLSFSDYNFSGKESILDKLKKAISKVYQSNRQALDEGFSEWYTVEREVASVGGNQYSAHGMGKTSIASAFTDLINLFEKGINPFRGQGALDVATLAGGVSDGTTAGGAYMNGAFTLVANRNHNGRIENVNQIGGIIVNEGIATPEVLSALKELFPNLIIESTLNSKALVEQLNAKYDAELAALEQSKKSAPPEITSTDFEQFDLRGKEGRQAREQLRTKYGAEAVSRMEDITKNFEQTISDLEKQGKIRKECP
jgi:hypothetical protein